MESEGAWPDSEPGPYAFEFPAGERPAEAITEAVTWFVDADEAEVGPIEEVVDVEWLSKLFAYHRRAGGTDGPSEAASGPSLTFEYAGCLVTVEPGRFTVERVGEVRPSRAVEATTD
jgi:hypothetical protein